MTLPPTIGRASNENVSGLSQKARIEHVRFAGLSRAVSVPNGLLSRLGKTAGAVCSGAPLRLPLFRRLR
jgi:hypothetical protein